MTAPHADPETSHDGKRDGLLLGGIILLTAFAFAQVSHFDFINLDDDSYVTANAMVQKGLTSEGIAWAFKTTEVGNWQPLTWLSHMLDTQLFGMRPGPRHMMSLTLHELAAAALFLFLMRITGSRWRSAFVAILFALHPLHVESVAWISERKDVLSGLMWLLALDAYTRYARQPAWTRYLLVVLCFVLGLMSKPMVVTLPLILLLLDYWPLGNIGSDPARTLPWLIIEKLPLGALSVATAVATVFAQRQYGAIASTDTFPFMVRVHNALVASITYLIKALYPIGLAVPYPHPANSLPAWQIAGATCALIVITVLTIAAMRRCPYLFVGWFWYLITLLPVIGLVQVGGQAMADRYTYLPLIGPFIAAAWGARDLGSWFLDFGFAKESRARTFLFAIPAAAIILALSVLTMLQTSHWRDSISLFQHTLAVTKHNSIAHNNLGTALMDKGRYEEAAAHFTEAVKEAPDNTGALNNLGVMCLVLSKPAEAASIFAKVLERTPGDATVESNLGVALLQQGNPEAARMHLDRALKLDPNCEKARKALALLPGH